MKKIIIYLMVFCMMFIGVGCGNKDEAASGDKTVVESEEKAEEERNQTENQAEAKESVEDNTDETTDEDIAEVEPTSAPQGDDDLNEMEKLEALVMKDIEDTISGLREEYELLLSEIDTYEKYLESTERIETFYDTVYNENLMLCIRMREYSVDFAEMILASGKSFDDMYDDLEIIYDCIYDDAGDDLYDEIYDGILDDMYDDYYDGILDDAYDNAEYKEWSSARSDEYDWWSDCRSDVYEEWSDFRSEVYDFYSDMRSEIWDDDMEKAYKEIEDFVEDIEKIK